MEQPLPQHLELVPAPAGHLLPGGRQPDLRLGEGGAGPPDGAGRLLRLLLPPVQGPAREAPGHRLQGRQRADPGRPARVYVPRRGRGRRGQPQRLPKVRRHPAGQGVEPGGRAARLEGAGRGEGCGQLAARHAQQLHHAPGHTPHHHQGRLQVDRSTAGTCVHHEQGLPLHVRHGSARPAQVPRVLPGPTWQRTRHLLPPHLAQPLQRAQT